MASQEEANDTAERFLKYVKSPLLTDIKVKFEGFDAYDVQPAGEGNVPDLFAQRPLVIYGKYKHASGRIKVTGNTASGKYEKIIEVTKNQQDNANSALEYLWAREKIACLSDYAQVGQEVKDEVTKLGLKYHLMTEYTSFVAVDSLKRNTGEIVSVKQPLPLPAEVSNYAVGGGYAKMKCAKVGGSPMMDLGCEYKKDVSMDKSAPEPAEYETGPVAVTEEESGQLYIISSQVPSGITSDELQQAVLNRVKDELEQAFKKWSLEKVDVEMKIQNGAVVSVKVISYTGKKCEPNALEKILKKVIFDGSLTGTAEMELDFN